SITLLAGQNGINYNFGESSPFTPVATTYPYSSANALTNVAFNASDALRGVTASVANGTFNIFYNSQHALALGVREVDTKLKGTTTTGSNTATGAPAGRAAGEVVSGTGIPAGTTVVSVGATTVTLSNNATASGLVTLTFARTYALSPL